MLGKVGYSLAWQVLNFQRLIRLFENFSFFSSSYHSLRLFFPDRKCKISLGYGLYIGFIGRMTMQ